MDPKRLKHENEIVEANDEPTSDEVYNEELYSTSEIEELQEKLNQVTNERDNFLIENESLKQEQEKVVAEKQKLEEIIRTQNNIIQEVNSERDKLSVTLDAVQEKLINVIKLYNNAIQNK